jgi:hypothetical protein
VRRFTKRVAPLFSRDLHVLGAPPAFVLSQDQTLQMNLEHGGRQVVDPVSPVCLNFNASPVLLNAPAIVWRSRLALTRRFERITSPQTIGTALLFVSLLFSFQRPKGPANFGEGP